MDLCDASRTARSVRRLSDEPVDESAIRRMLRAAAQASSGGDIEPYQVLVVTDAVLEGRFGNRRSAIED